MTVQVTAGVLDAVNATAYSTSSDHHEVIMTTYLLHFTLGGGVHTSQLHILIALMENYITKKSSIFQDAFGKCKVTS